jgi:hypothetical protein
VQRKARTGSTTTTLVRRRRALGSGALGRSSEPVGSAAARCVPLNMTSSAQAKARCAPHGAPHAQRGHRIAACSVQARKARR